MWALMSSRVCRRGGRSPALAASKATAHGPGARPSVFHWSSASEVHAGERGVPPLQPRSVEEAALLDPLGHRHRHASIGREEVATLVPRRFQRGEELVHPGHDAPDDLRSPSHGGAVYEAPSPEVGLEVGFEVGLKVGAHTTEERTR
jgi:hypothetical protein